MNKKVLSLSLLFSCVAFLSAQDQSELSRDLIPENVEYGQSNQTYNAYKTSWKKNAVGDNWTISVGGGAQVLFGIDDNKGDFQNRVTFSPQLSLSKYFSPIWGLRVNFSGGSLHGYNDGNYGTYVKWNHGTKNYMGQGFVGTAGYPTSISGKDAGAAMLTWDPSWVRRFGAENTANPGSEGSVIGVDGDNFYWKEGRYGGKLYMDHVRYFQANIDFMVDVFTLFGNYNPKRFFELTAFGGIGLYNSFAHYDGVNVMVAGVHGGLIGKFRLTERFGLHAEFSGSMVPDSFDGQVGDHQPMDGIGQATLSVAYKMGKTSWNVCEPMDYELINRMQADINKLRDELANKKCPTCPPPVPVPVPAPEKAEEPQLVFLPDPVFFRIDKSVIDKAEWVKIDKAAIWLKEHPQAKVVVTGYADKATAYPEYNMKLSERRSKTVAKALIERYGISPDRVSVSWSGDAIQPFMVNEWNRVVIFVIEN